MTMKTGGKRGEGWARLWKRNAVVAAIAVFVCAAVYLNWSYTQEIDAEAGKTLGGTKLVGSMDPLLDEGENKEKETSAPQQQVESGYFATARLNRRQARDSALSLLRDAASGTDADQTMKDEASQAIQTMADYTVTEAQIENLITAKGYQECVAFIGEDSVSIAVTAPEAGIGDVDTARIVDAVGQVTEFTAPQIHIIEVN